MLRYKGQINRSVNHVLRYQSFYTERASDSSFEVVRRSNLKSSSNLSSVPQSLSRLCGSFCLWLQSVDVFLLRSPRRKWSGLCDSKQRPRVLETGPNQFGGDIWPVELARGAIWRRLQAVWSSFPTQQYRNRVPDRNGSSTPLVKSTST